MPETKILVCDVRDMLRELPEGSVHCVVTSPPYFALRDYGVAGQIGLEATPEEYIATMVDVFREVRRVLRDDGTLWLNIGDSYAASGMGGNPEDSPFRKQATNVGSLIAGRRAPRQCKPKDLLGIPWQLAFALRADGWYLRSEIIWHKPNPMPESVTDRPTKSHEQIFLLTKSPRYFFDQEAVREAHADNWYDRAATWRNGDAKQQQRGETYHPYGEAKPFQNPQNPSGRNLRSVWSIATEPYAEAHFATFPKAIPEKCIKAGTSEKGCCAECGAPWVRVVEKHRQPTRPGSDTKVNGHDGMTTGNRDPQRHVTESVTKGWEAECDCNAACVLCTVLDPFSGSGTTGVVAKALGRNYIGCELNPEYAEMSLRRIAKGYESKPKREVLAGQKELF